MWVFELNFLLYTRDSFTASINAKGLGVNMSMNHSSFLFIFSSVIWATTQDTKSLSDKQDLWELNTF